jgi:hypothetical protein
MLPKGYVSSTTLLEGAGVALDALKQFDPILLGGFAVTYYAEPRATQDFDLTLSPEDLLKARTLLLELGFTHTDTTEFRGVLLHHYASGAFRLDLLEFKNPEFQQVIASTARPVSLLGRSLRIIAPEALIATKLLGFRPKDKIDILTLLATENLAIDLHLVKQYAQMLKIFDRYAFIETA